MLLALGLALLQDDVQPWIDKLGSPEYAVREEAQKKIEGMGPSVAPQLKAALEKTQDMEVKTRLEEIIKKFEKPRETKQVEEAKPDPNKQLEKAATIVGELQKVLADKDKSVEEKLRKIEGLADDLRDAVRRKGADQTGLRVVRRFQFNGRGFEQIPEDMRRNLEEQQKRTQELIEKILKDHGWGDPDPEKKEDKKN